MIKFRIEKVDQKVPEKIVCDVCKKEYDCQKDFMEAQEFHHIRFTGGYGSVFGDMSTVRVDICQHCLLEMIKDYYVVENVYEEEVKDVAKREKHDFLDDGWRN